MRRDAKTAPPISKFGDIIALATGRLERTQDGATYELRETNACAEGTNINCTWSENVTALWYVEKIRHRQPSRGHELELKITILPMMKKHRGDSKREIGGGGGGQLKPRSFVVRETDYPKYFEDQRQVHDRLLTKRTFDMFSGLTAASNGFDSYRIPLHYNNYHRPPKLNTGEYYVGGGGADHGTTGRDFYPPPQPFPTAPYIGPTAFSGLSGAHPQSQLTRPIRFPTGGGVVEYQETDQFGPPVATTPFTATHLHHHFYLNKNNVPLVKATAVEKENIVIDHSTSNRPTTATVEDHQHNDGYEYDPIVHPTAGYADDQTDGQHNANYQIEPVGGTDHPQPPPPQHYPSPPPLLYQHHQMYPPLQLATPLPPSSAQHIFYNQHQDLLHHHQFQSQPPPPPPPQPHYHQNHLYAPTIIDLNPRAVSNHHPDHYSDNGAVMKFSDTDPVYHQQVTTVTQHFAPHMLPHLLPPGHRGGYADPHHPIFAHRLNINYGNEVGGDDAKQLPAASQPQPNEPPEQIPLDSNQPPPPTAQQETDDNIEVPSAPSATESTQDFPTTTTTTIETFTETTATIAASVTTTTTEEPPQYPDSINAQLPAPEQGEDLTVPYVDSSTTVVQTSQEETAAAAAHHTEKFKIYVPSEMTTETRLNPVSRPKTTILQPVDGNHKLKRTRQRGYHLPTTTTEKPILKWMPKRGGKLKQATTTTTVPNVVIVTPTTQDHEPPRTSISTSISISSSSSSSSESRAKNVYRDPGKYAGFLPTLPKNVQLTQSNVTMIPTNSSELRLYRASEEDDDDGGGVVDRQIARSIIEHAQNL